MRKRAPTLQAVKQISRIPAKAVVDREPLDSRVQDGEYLNSAESSVTVPSPWEFAIVFGVLAVLFIGANWAGLSSLVEAWDREQDYSHGYLVAPIACLFLWFKRDRFPGIRDIPGWAGLGLIAASAVLFAAGKQYFLNPLIHWSMIVWIGGATWVLAGRRVLWWALPSIGFLIFMVPLPYRTENWLSGPLQRVATQLSTWTLQLLGQPAFAEGNTILLGEGRLEVEQACSGLRMLVMITALAVACAVLVCRNWPERLLLIVCIVPIALFSNAVRIVATGLALTYISPEASENVHNIAGLIVVLVASSTMWLALVYWRHLFLESERTPLYRAHGEELIGKGI